MADYDELQTEEQRAGWVLFCTPHCYEKPGRSALFKWLWLENHVECLGGFLATYQLLQGLAHIPDDLLEIVVEIARYKYLAWKFPVSLPALLEDCREAQAKLDRISELNQLRRSYGLDEPE